MPSCRLAIPAKDGRTEPWCLGRDVSHAEMRPAREGTCCNDLRSDCVQPRPANSHSQRRRVSPSSPFPARRRLSMNRFLKITILSAAARRHDFDRAGSGRRARPLAPWLPSFGRRRPGCCRRAGPRRWRDRCRRADRCPPYRPVYDEPIYRRSAAASAPARVRTTSSPSRASSTTRTRRRWSLGARNGSAIAATATAASIPIPAPYRL